MNNESVRKENIHSLRNESLFKYAVTVEGAYVSICSCNYYLKMTLITLPRQFCGARTF